MSIPRVFVDATVLKFSATELPRYVARKTSDKWGGTIVEGVVHEPVEINPNDFIKNPDLKSEAELLPRAAELGKTGTVEYVMSMELLVGDSWNLRNMDSRSGRFYGAPIAIVDAPFDGGRIVGGVGISRNEEQLRFFTSIKDKRFLELQKMTGAYQGKQPVNQNQLLDAFHLWCAEHNGCEFFLTLDFKLINVLGLAKKKKVVRVVRPSELLASIRT